MPIRLLLADDERLFRQSLKILLETGTDLEVVADAADGQEAVAGARDTEPHLALLDVDMPRMDGIKAARLIGAVSPRTKILMLSVHHEEDKIRAAIRAGALGYILKDTDRHEFVKIIRETHGGKIPTSPYLAHLYLEAAANHDTAVDREARLREKFSLTEMEMRVLKLVIEGLSNDEIGEVADLARETIKGHLKALFRKLEVKNRTEAAVLAVREGLH